MRGGNVEIVTWFADARVHVSIRDDGAGIPEDQLNRVSDPGFTTKGISAGTGLGLAICDRIVKPTTARSRRQHRR